MRARRRRAVQGEPRTAGKGRRTIPGMEFADTKKNNALIMSEQRPSISGIDDSVWNAANPEPACSSAGEGEGGRDTPFSFWGKVGLGGPPPLFFTCLPPGESEREEGGELSVPADGKKGGRPPPPSPLSHLHTNFPPGGKGSCT